MPGVPRLHGARFGLGSHDGVMRHGLYRLGRRQRHAFWATAIRLLPSAKFTATTAVYRETSVGERNDPDSLTTANLEFVWRYYFRLVSLLIPCCRRRLQRDIRAQGTSRLSCALSKGNGAIVVSAHLGEMELAGSWLAQACGHEVVVVVDEVAPRCRQVFFDAVRRACGLRLRRQAVTSLDDLSGDLAAGRIVLLMLDRHSTSETLPVSFLGRRSSLPASQWALSSRTGAPVLVGTTFRSTDGICTVRFGAPRGLAELRHLGARRLTQGLASDLELAIFDAPEQWHLPADVDQLPFEPRHPQDCHPAPAFRHPIGRAHLKPSPAASIPS